jgi:hypothetical protein
MQLDLGMSCVAVLGVYLVESTLSIIRVQAPGTEPGASSFGAPSRIATWTKSNCTSATPVLYTFGPDYNTLVFPQYLSILPTQTLTYTHLTHISLRQ